MPATASCEQDSRISGVLDIGPKYSVLSLKELRIRIRFATYILFT